MKKKILSLVLLVALVLFTGCTVTTNNINKLSYKDYSSKIKNNDSFILYIGEKNSSLYKTLNDALNELNIEGYMINEDDLGDKELLEFRDKINYTGDTIVFIKDGVDPSTLSHLETGATKKEIINTINDFEYIATTSETASVTE